MNTAVASHDGRLHSTRIRGGEPVTDKLSVVSGFEEEENLQTVQLQRVAAFVYKEEGTKFLLRCLFFIFNSNVN